ncbi:hypothetical protein C1H46_009464 [Malus baccata]|uniref:Uncharacterized protein n=1 Tax=Malus baccata TaxID=106549 RepID=A0A540N368_MALBA|nr:hypothetical protein C1H46_009464 [Malus baccata]
MPTDIPKIVCGGACSSGNRTLIITNLWIRAASLRKTILKGMKNTSTGNRQPAVGGYKLNVDGAFDVAQRYVIRELGLLLVILRAGVQCCRYSCPLADLSIVNWELHRLVTIGS